VAGTGTGVDREGRPVIRIFTERAGIGGFPKDLDGVPVQAVVSGRFYALNTDNPNNLERWEERPVPIGVSTGHPAITAGTIGARVSDGSDVFALSNNHVYAASNAATIGDAVLQPGAADGGVSPAYDIGTLYDYQEINFCYVYWFWLVCPEVNTMDAAIALSDTGRLGFATPAGGYDAPAADIHAAYGDPSRFDADDPDEDLGQLLGLAVQKYGRTTALTHGWVTAIHATVNVGYDNLVAQFTDQIIIEPAAPSNQFSAGGDSGSLVVSEEGNHPVGLLFAGSDTQTIANRIDRVLDRFGVTIDGGPVAEITDIAIMSVEAPASIVPGETVPVTVTVKNVGTFPVESIQVSLTDDTDTLIRPESPISLNAGASAGIDFEWPADAETTAETLTLTASLTVQDENSDNNAASVTITFVDPTDNSPHLQIGKTMAWSDAWTTIILDHTYNDLVVVCTPNYDRYTTPSVVAVRNAGGNTFQLRLAPAVYGLFASEPPWSAEVHWAAVEAGVYTEADHGLKMEALKAISTVTDAKGAWTGQPRAYENSYAAPVVVGQVMSYNADRDYYWSVFWSRGPSVTSPPSAGALWVGKHIGEEVRSVNDETVGYIVIEAGSGNIGGIAYVAGIGSDTIRGMDNAPPYRYAAGLPQDAVAVLSSAGMDGGDGCWPVLYGSSPVTMDQLYLAVDEDWVWDSERRHTHEQVSYVVFGQ
jgi:hypothetical protein